MPSVDEITLDDLNALDELKCVRCDNGADFLIEHTCCRRSNFACAPHTTEWEERARKFFAAFSSGRCGFCRARHYRFEDAYRVTPI
jgi:hypothetical protein